MGRIHLSALTAIVILCFALAGCGPRPAASPPTSTTTPLQIHAGHPTVPLVPAAPSVTPVAPGAAKPARPARQEPRGLVAVVNGEGVPTWEFNALLRLNLENAGAAAASPASPSWAAVYGQTARQVVDEALLNAYAQAHGLAVAPAAVDARLAVYRLQGGGGFAASLARLGIDAAQFRRMVARNLNAQAVTRHVIDAIAAPAVRVQVVQVVVPTQKEARQVWARLLRGADPALVAVRESSDPTLRRLAGQLPPLTRAQGDALYGPRWSVIAFRLAPGAVGGPVHLRDGWAVIQVVERQPAPALMARALGRFVADLRRRARIVSYVN